MLKTFLISSVVLTLLFGAVGVSVAAAKEMPRGEPVVQADITDQQIRSTVNNQFQTQNREQIMLGTSEDTTAMQVQDCDGTPDRDRDRVQDQTQDRDQDRIHLSEPAGTQNHGYGQPDSGNDPGHGYGNQP